MGSQHFLKTSLIQIPCKIVNILVSFAAILGLRFHSVNPYKVSTLFYWLSMLLSIIARCHYHNSQSSSWLNHLLLQAESKRLLCPREAQKKQKAWRQIVGPGSVACWGLSRSDHRRTPRLPCNLILWCLAFISSFFCFLCYEACTKMCSYKLYKS